MGSFCSSRQSVPGRHRIHGEEELAADQEGYVRGFTFFFLLRLVHGGLGIGARLDGGIWSDFSDSRENLVGSDAFFGWKLWCYLISK